MRRILRIILILAFSRGSASLAADLARGLAAVDRQDWAAALAEFRPLAEQGDPAAEANLGNLYMKGYGVEQDYNAAFRWYLRAAEQGNSVAQGKLGLLHYYGLGVREDHEAAAHWFLDAAKNGDVDAASVLASLYAAGDGVARDRAEAFLWYGIAAERGHPTAAEHRDQLADEMSPGEIADGLDRLSTWRGRNESLVPDVPAERAPTAARTPTDGAQSPVKAQKAPMKNKGAAASKRKAKPAAKSPAASAVPRTGTRVHGPQPK